MTCSPLVTIIGSSFDYPAQYSSSLCIRGGAQVQATRNTQPSYAACCLHVGQVQVLDGAGFGGYSGQLIPTGRVVQLVSQPQVRTSPLPQSCLSLSLQTSVKLHQAEQLCLHQQPTCLLEQHALAPLISISYTYFKQYAN